MILSYSKTNKRLPRDNRQPAPFESGFSQSSLDVITIDHSVYVAPASLFDQFFGAWWYIWSESLWRGVSIPVIRVSNSGRRDTHPLRQAVCQRYAEW